MVRLLYPRALEEMKDLVAKELFIDAIVDGDGRLRLKQSRPQSIRASLTPAMELESYQVAFRQREYKFEPCIVVQQKGVQLMNLIAGNCSRMMYLHKLKDCSLKYYPPKVSGPHCAGLVGKGAT